MAEDTFAVLKGALDRGLGRFGKGGDKRSAKSAAEKIQEFGVLSVGIHSDDDDIAVWEKRLWESQDELVEQRAKEWLRNLHYCAGEQHIAYHKIHRRWIPRKSVPWRIRSVYNLVQKAVNLRTARLTENKPMVTVQASTASVEDVEKAEYKETLFWYLWEKLQMHRKVGLARRWGCKCGSGFLKFGWSPDAGPPIPVTKKVPRYETITSPLDPEQPALGERSEQVYAGIQEVYLDKDGAELGPVRIQKEDPLNADRTVEEYQEPPEDVEYYHEGEVFCDVRSPFNVRFDQYVNDPLESWYFQDAEVLPLSKILAMFPNKAEDLRAAKTATEEQRMSFQMNGLIPIGRTTTGTFTTYGGYRDQRGDEKRGPVDKEYVVRETWVFPDNEFLRKLWGPQGAMLITVGDTLVHKSSLPAWALKAKPLIQFTDILEEGNHYNKSFLRDLVPLQDDINRTRSHQAEASAIASRLILGAPQGHRVNLQLLAEMPAVMLTYRSPQHEPKPIQFGRPDNGAVETFYAASLSAANDAGQMQDASTGKLPAAGIAAKAIYALQWADERGISEISNLQDLSLQACAKVMDEITKEEYKETRKIRIVGEDRAYMVEQEIGPDALIVDVDYHFVPGSMLAKQKEVIRNEMLTLYEAGLIEGHEVRKYLATSVPDVFRRSYDLQEARAKRVLHKMIKENAQHQPMPFDDPQVFMAVFQEFMLSHKWDGLPEMTQQLLLQTWQGYAVQHQQQQMQQIQMQAMIAQATGGGAGGTPAKPSKSQGAESPEEPVVRGAQDMERRATGAMQPPQGFGEQRSFLQ
jgi:hypothetical protein